MSVDWVGLHTDAHHPGGRETCEQCQAMIEIYGPMPPIDDILREERNSARHNLYRKEKIPNELRQAVFERDGYTCLHCGATDNLRADHIFPERKGGKAVMSNLQTLCNRCNSKKRDKV